MPRIGSLTRSLLAAAACVAFAGVASAQAVLREGVGDRREALNKTELTDFDQSLWSSLSDWRNGEPLDASNTAGKVVLIYTWSSFLPTATRPLAIVNRLAGQHADDGLIVVGVHHDQAWEDGVAMAEKRRVTFPIARDTNNAFREALDVDQDPDFYVIDRAGRMRYADIETASVDKAVTELLAEDAGEAANLLDRMAAERKAKEEEARRTARLRSQIDLSTLPWVPFDQPSAEAYESAGLPKIKQDNTNNRYRSQQAQPNATVSWEGADFRPAPPESTDGRATLIYFFTDEAISQFSRGGGSAVALFQYMDQLQAANARDLIVVGAMIPATTENNNRYGQDNGEAAKKAATAGDRFQQIVREIPVNHIRVNDYAGGWIQGKIDPRNGTTQRGGSGGKVFALPYHILASSDGKIRWHGAISTSTERFAEWEAALDTLLRNDPGIKARREAEEAYLKSLTD